MCNRSDNRLISATLSSTNFPLSRDNCMYFSSSFFKSANVLPDFSSLRDSVRFATSNETEIRRNMALEKVPFDFNQN